MPRAYMEYRIMKEMGWTYQELQATPAEEVANIIRYLNTEAKYEREQIRRARSKT